MKKLILLINSMLLVAVMNATNIKNTDVTTPSGTLNVSVEQYTSGIDLINTRQFIIKANTLYSQDEKRFYTVNPQCNFLVMDCERAKLQVTNNEQIGFYEEHKVSDVKISVSKKGDIIFTALLKDSRKAIRMKIKLQKGSNSCEAVFSSAKRSGNYTFVGELCPLDESNIVKLY